MRTISVLFALLVLLPGCAIFGSDDVPYRNEGVVYPDSCTLLLEVSAGDLSVQFKANNRVLYKTVPAEPGFLGFHGSPVRESVFAPGETAEVGYDGAYQKMEVVITATAWDADQERFYKLQVPRLLKIGKRGTVRPEVFRMDDFILLIQETDQQAAAAVAEAAK